MIQGRRGITKGVFGAYREGGTSFFNYPKYTYQIKGKEIEENSPLLQNKEEHLDKTRETTNPYQDSDYHRGLIKRTRGSIPSREEGRRRNIKTIFS